MEHFGLVLAETHYFKCSIEKRSGTLPYVYYYITSHVRAQDFFYLMNKTKLYLILRFFSEGLIISLGSKPCE